MESLVVECLHCSTTRVARRDRFKHFESLVISLSMAPPFSSPLKFGVSGIEPTNAFLPSDE